ncbi:MAG: hypothetical protein JAZ15_14600 [Candidatus Thiodiazotropha endolucinida]|nr:hypothetical protein [Candidatus Thiodiazotropha taylori]MCW4344301.1 hypothetical protein [Candidatus Thiodiazotropha endolucinida]MCG8046589.1 hypothetical protein [Candidatus Thiodiazotropha taylori]MCG8052434.1 hypothetical protein [Candidatus Thiodiazotropha taylori]MCW4314256.1 hypothetical protein [Candidatus Thiodiazotropha taylori]
MKEDEAYLDVARRFQESCEQHIAHNIDLQEVIGFKSYHAFESIGGAYISHHGRRVPKRHISKLNEFIAIARHDINVNDHAIAALAMLLNSMRNKYLYPEKTGTDYKRPQDQISLTDARSTVRRIKGIIRQVEKNI